jgi:hypothetical protein
VSFQIHYTPSGVAKKERLKMGLVFASEKPQYEVRTVGVANMGISIPAHAAAHEAKAPAPAAAAGADGGLRPALTPAPPPEMRPIDAVPVVDTHR